MDPTQVERDEHGVMRCRECGFEYGLTQTEVLERSRQGLDAVRRAVVETDDSRRAMRPEPSTWSVNAYLGHLSDAAAVIATRVRRIAEQDRPALEYHDQDEAVQQQQQDHVLAARSLGRLERTVDTFLAYLSELPPGAWERVGIHARAGEVRLADIAHDMPHELLHHAGDVRQVDRRVRESASHARTD